MKNYYNLLDGVLEHRRNQSCKVWWRKLEAWVCVHFDQPRLQVFVDHEVVAEDFERAVTAVWINLSWNCFDRVCRDCLELGHDGFHEVAADVNAIQIFLELRIGELNKSG